MAYIPKDAEWYIAELIKEIRVEDEPANVVHRELTLVNASSPEDAYQKSIALGTSSEISYTNPNGKKVSILFRGLGDLCVIHDALEHGAELMYSEDFGISEEELGRLIRCKLELTVFREDVPSSKSPDYRSEDVVERVKKMISRDE